RLLNKVFRNLFVRGITDSQAGLKGFTDSAARAIFPLTTVDGFSFDIEVLYIARHLGLTIEEVGINFDYGREPSTVNFLKDGFGLMRDMIKTKVNKARGIYDAPGQSNSAPARQRLLVVTADDFGLSEQANRGIVRGVEAGAVSSVSVMAWPYLEPWPDAICCDVGFGLHINLTEGRPASGADGLEPILTDDGRFCNLAMLSMQMLKGAVSVERLTRELLGQAEKVRRAGFVLDHIDGHEHVQHLPGVRQAVAEVARRLGIVWVRVAAERLGYELRAWGCTARKIALMPFLVSARSFFLSCGLQLPDRFFGLALVRPRNFEMALSAAMDEADGDVNEISLHLAESGGEQTDRLGKWRCETLETLLRCDLPGIVAGTRLKLTNFGKIADREQYTTVAGKEMK
ncbi:MAG: ChbG/HpnK family deacetylase, partial [Planctomycetota bacterium]|nr:ChbG/HpnK family deacetylase [Planctomycetota bacterium]